MLAYKGSTYTYEGKKPKYKGNTFKKEIPQDVLEASFVVAKINITLWLTELKNRTGAIL